MASRIARACEQCRKSKRRCKPPYPCVNCLSSGVPCEVREKARPHRRRNQSHWSSSTASQVRITSPQRPLSPPSTGVSSIPDISTDSTEKSQSRNTPNTPGLVKADTFELVRSVIAEYALTNYGYELRCDLSEPKQSLSTAIHEDERFPTGFWDSSVIYLDKVQMHHLIKILYERWGSHPRAVNIEHLQEAVDSLFAHFYHQTSIELSSKSLKDSGLALDSLALLFASLALGSYFSEDYQNARRFFADSTDLFNNYTGPPSFDAVATLFVQHLFALRVGSANQAKNLNVQAIHAAHDLGINRGAQTASKLQYVELYLLLYFTDQYSTQSHNTPPTIKTTDYHPDLFQPLARAYPKLRTFIELIKLNGHIFEHVYGQRCSDESVLNLESIIGRVCEAIGKPLRNAPGREGTEYDVLVKIHMFWCRLILRAPSINSCTHWVSSLSICVRAAQMLLSIYIGIYKPGVQNAVEHIEPALSPLPAQSLLIDNAMPPTWRQVKRLTTSAFVIMYAYWRGEASAEETSRYIAMALLLLHCQRVRWKHELTEAMGTLEDLIGLSGLELGPAFSILLPGATFDFISAIISTSSSHTEVCVRAQRTPPASHEEGFEQSNSEGSFSQFDDLLDRSAGSMHSDPLNFMDYATWLPTPLVGLFGDV